MHLVYMYKGDLALNNPQRLICHKPRPNQTWTHYDVAVHFFNFYAIETPPSFSGAQTSGMSCY